MRFEWDDAKEVRNQRKHGLSFAEARRLFESGANYLEIFVLAEPGEGLVRIIGVRLATRRERAVYRSHMERRG